MDAKEAQEKLSEAFELLQGMIINSTLSNLESLLKSMYNIRDVNGFLEKEDATSGRVTANSK